MYSLCLQVFALALMQTKITFTLS